MAEVSWLALGAPLPFVLLAIPGLALVNGLVVTVVAVLLVLGRVLWPKEAMQRRQAERRFRSSVTEMRQGLDQLEDEQYAEALALFQIAAERTPNKPAPVLLRSYALGLQGQHRQAAQELRRALQKWPVETLPKRLLALAYLGSGQFDRAYTVGMAAASEEPIAPAALRTLGDICRLMERYPEAERLYQQAILADLPRPSAGLAWVLASQGRVIEAEEELAQTPERRRNLFETQLTLAHIHTQARRYDDALAVYDTLLKAHADVPRVLVPYGLTLLEAGDSSDGVRALDRAIAYGPDDPFAHCGLASALVEKNDLAAAIVHVREALRLWPGYGHARSVYGDVLKRSGKYDSAEEQYRDALRLNPFLAETHARLGALLRARNANDEAREHEREAHRLRPSIPLVMSQKMQAITSAMLAVPAPTSPPPTPVERPADPPDVHVTLTNTAKRLPDRRAQPEAPQPAPAPLPSLPSLPSMPSDIAAFPGAALIFDESRESVFSQTLQTAKAPDEVARFYRDQMAAARWRLEGEEQSAVAQLRGLTLHYERFGQLASITIGVQQTARALPGGAAEPEPTFIVTTVAFSS